MLSPSWTPGLVTTAQGQVQVSLDPQQWSLSQVQVQVPVRMPVQVRSVQVRMPVQVRSVQVRSQRFSPSAVVPFHPSFSVQVQVPVQVRSVQVSAVVPFR
jgi:hypothetical protein